MLIKTLIDHQNKLTSALVEIQLIPGLPQIHFLGLPDKVIKESFFRIKSALKSSGFYFPVTHQVIVNIRPSSLKKSSLGLELAVALGILHLTGQKKLPDLVLNHLIYGELGLDGQVLEPEDLCKFKNESQEFILTGQSFNGLSVFSKITHLKNDFEFQLEPKRSGPIQVQLPKDLDLKFTSTEAELIFLMATTRMHTLLAGQAGSGKSYLAKNYKHFLGLSMIAPHHSLTPGAFLGGGVSLQSGEIEKIENGILILDELLEFSPIILESLREPMTGEVLRLARGARVKEIKPDFQVVSTTNFCPCGKWVPNANDQFKYNSCRFSVVKCKGYLNRLSGPLVDRFGLLYFSQSTKEKRGVCAATILKRIESYKLKMQALADQGINQLNYDQDYYELIYGELSGRRKKALLKAAEVYAIESDHPEILQTDLKLSESWTINGFLHLEKGMC